MTSADPPLAFVEADRAAVYRAIRERRDIRRQFTGEAMNEQTLRRLLEAAHLAPSVGFSQPWDFILVRDPARRQAVKRLVQEERAAFAGALQEDRARLFRDIKVEGIVESSLNICVTCDRTRGGRFVLGRHTIAETAAYSTCLAIANLWLAARAEGVGVGWVSFYRRDDLRRILGLPPHLDPIAYLCVGPVSEFPPLPDLEAHNWEHRRRLGSHVFDERWGCTSALFPGGGAMVVEDRIRELASDIGRVDARAAAAARERQDQPTRPAGSLGRLDEIGVRLAGIARRCPPPVPQRVAVIIAAGDHGVLAQGVSPWPKEVTAAMVAGFCSGHAAVNALAKVVGAEVTVLDVGVAGDLPAHPRLRHAKIRPGTDDCSQRPAMTRQEAARAILAGAGVAGELIASGVDLLVTGDMGIANTTPAACLIAAFTGRAAGEVTGRGTGIDDATWEVKVTVVDKALRLHAPDPADPIGVVAAVGGLEHAALAGMILAGAAAGVPVILDGVNADAAALLARAVAPLCIEYLFAGHRSVEPGASVALDHLGLEPLVDAGMRLGEGTGALLAVPVIRGAAAVLGGTATFDGAGVGY
jgi:nicotinate-nucleotide--dimethylbenzimidazole phosphoribosyltransferase